MMGQCAGCSDIDPPTIKSGHLTIHDHAGGAHDFNSGREVRRVGERWELVDGTTVGPADFVIPEDFL